MTKRQKKYLKAQRQFRKAVGNLDRSAQTQSARDAIDQLRSLWDQTSIEIWDYENSNITGEEKDSPVGPINSY